MASKSKEYPLCYIEVNSDLAEEEFYPFMEFRLIYEGQLLSGNNSQVQNQQQIRKQLHPQLKSYYEIHPSLKRWATGFAPGYIRTTRRTNLDVEGDNYQRGNFRFVPLVNDKKELVCELDILFLRRDQPGHLIREGGDIDNRIKTLFDALKVPVLTAKLGEPAPSEDPFFTLLEDDRLITKVSITTERLLRPLAPDKIQSGERALNDVVLMIHVKVLKSFGVLPTLIPDEGAI